MCIHPYISVLILHLTTPPQPNPAQLLSGGAIANMSAAIAQQVAVGSQAQTSRRAFTARRVNAPAQVRQGDGAVCCRLVVVHLEKLRQSNCGTYVDDL